MNRGIVLALPLALLPAIALAQSALVGTWKADLGNLQLPTKPDEFQLRAGEWQCKTCAPPVTVKADGQPHPVSGHPYYDSMAVRIVDDHTVVESDVRKGKTVTTTTYRISADGKTLTQEFDDSSNSNAAPVTGAVEETRVASGPAGSHAVSGGWRATKVLSASDNGLVFTYALEGSKLKMTNLTGQTYTAPMDGSDAPFMGDPGQTSVAIKRVDDHNYDETDKREGKVIGTSHIRVAADGKSMTVAWKDMLHDTSGSFTAIRQ